MIRACFFAVVFWAAICAYSARAQAPLPSALAAQGETTVLTVHAEGAQIYECKAESSGRSMWLYREPIATLLLNGKTIGRHYAGPTWELNDGSVVTGKVVSNAPGTTPADIPWLKLDAVSHRGNGLLANVTTTWSWFQNLPPSQRPSRRQ